MAMTSQSRYYRLRYLICVWFDGEWWSIAAFDNKAAAISYFKELKSLPADTQRYELLRRDNKDCWIEVDI